jgi:RNA polymerase sigma factor (sigma-70 family)
MGSPSESCSSPVAGLVALALVGDKDAFADLVTGSTDVVLAVTRRVVGDHLVDDVLQEAVVVALVNLPRLRNPERFASWLCGIALNVARRRRRDPPIDLLGDVELPDSARQPDEIAEAAATARRVRAAIDALPNGQRRAAQLYYLHELNQREIALRLEISPSAVKSRLHDARSSLARALSAESPKSDRREQGATMPQSPTTTTGWINATIITVCARDDDSGYRSHVAVLGDDSDRELPIWIGPAEAIMLAIGLEGEEMPRPLTYELATGLVRAASARIVEVRITRLLDGIFYGMVVVEGPGGRNELDARPSDALNLAVSTGAPILVAAGLLDDEEALRHTDWKDYPLSARDIVDERRQQVDAQQRQHGIGPAATEQG